MTQGKTLLIRLADDAETDIEDIWWHVARDSSSSTVADRLIERITERYSVLAKYPYLGPSRADMLGAGRRSLTVGEYVIVYTVEESEVRILRVVHGRRDLPGLFW